MEDTIEQGKKSAGADAAMVDLIRSVVREELSTGLVSKLDEKAGQLFEQEQWKVEFNRRLEGAFQTVLPQLIKRFKAEIDERLQEAMASASGGGSGLDFQKLAASDAMKELLDEKFRHMLLYLKQEVLPKAVQRAIKQG